MKDITSRTDYINKILLYIFPRDICKIIINIMLKLEFNDSKEDHKKNCLYFYIQKKIGINLSSLKPHLPPQIYFRFNHEIWRHIDRDNKIGKINYLITGLSDMYPQNYLGDEIFQQIISEINSKSENKLLLNLKILKNLDHFKSYQGVSNIISFYGHYLNLRAGNNSIYYYDDQTILNRYNEYVSLKKFHYDYNHEFYINDYHDQNQWEDLLMFNINCDQNYEYKRKINKRKIYHKKYKYNIKFKGR